MARTRKRPGTGALACCKTRLLQPSEIIKAQVPGVDILANHETNDLWIVRREEKSVRRRQQLCYIFHHPDYKNDDGYPIELHAVCNSVKIVEEGPPGGFFVDSTAVAVPPPEELAESLPDDILGFRLGDDVSALLRQGITIDDDNQPAPENVDQSPNDRVNMYGEWGFNGLCARRSASLGKNVAKLENFNGSYDDPQAMFEHFFPIKWLKEVLIVETNKNLNDNQLTYGEFLRWYGIWCIMATHVGYQRRDWWSTAPISMFTGAPFRFNDLMSHSRFEEIIQALRYTTDDPSDNDRFYEVRRMIAEWNENMGKNFRPSYISCLDQSMSPWTNQCSCPGYMYVPRKPHPFGNEYHSVACGESQIMWGIEIVEGKDAPAGASKPYDDKGGKTVGLLLRMTKPFWYTGISLVLDSGFCVLKALVELRKVGIFGAAVIKKRRYWPKYIDGDAVAAHFEDKQVGDFDCLPGALDGINFSIFAMKEPNYVMSLMATYGTDEEIETSRAVRTITSNNQTRTVTFKYTELFFNHFRFRNVVDAHNQLRHKPISLESTWGTSRWANRVFAFLLAITEVNVKLAMEYFGGHEKLPMLTFRRLIAEKMIHNRALEQEQTGTTNMNLQPVLVAHSLMTVPQYQRYNGRKFVHGKCQFPQRRCGGCRRKVRTYCSCSPTRAMCQPCYTSHIITVDEADPHGA